MLIQAYTETKHQMELSNDRKKMADFHEVIKKRRIQVRGETKEQQTFNQSIQLAEKFKSMEDHKIPIEEF